MGLAIEVGGLAGLAELDSEGAEYLRASFERVNTLLAKNGLPAHVEPEKLPNLDNRCSLDSYPYSFLHYLRRAFAHRVQNPLWIAAPLPEGGDPGDDPVVEQITSRQTSHLLCHSDAEGFYLPIDFAPILFDDANQIPGGMVGSSYRLRDELVLVAPALGIQLAGNLLLNEEAEAINSDLDKGEGIWIERIVWLSLFEASWLSIEHNAAIEFT
jgi:hypothetical protein